MRQQWVLGHTFEAFEGLKELGEGLRGELLVVLGGHLDADLQVLPDVGRQHGPQTLQGVLHRQGAKEVHQPLVGCEERGWVSHKDPGFRSEWGRLRDLRL